MTAGTPLPNAAAAGVRDFPEYLGPMLVKELRQGVRGKMFVVPFIGVHLAMLIALGFDLTRGHHSGGTGMVNYILPGLHSSSQSAFWLVAALLLLVITPWAGLGALTHELDGGNGELLLIAGQSRWKIVVGKWLTLCALGTLTAMTMLPYLMVRYFTGGMDVPATLSIGAALLMLNLTANAMAIGLSGYRGIGMRLIVGFFVVGSCYVTGMVVCGSTAYLFGSIFASMEILAVIAGLLLGLAATCLLFTVMGLQLGRMRIRLRVRPYDIPFESATSGGVVALIITAPFIIGITAVLTAGYAAMVGALLMAWAMAKMDPARRPTTRPATPVPKPDPALS